MLTPIAPDIWHCQNELVMSFGMHFQIRMTVVRLTDGSLLLHSPIPIDDDLAAKLAELGPVAYLVAPNCFHHLYIGPAKERYPQATVMGAPGLAEKRPDLHLDGVLGRDTPEELEAEFRFVMIEGAPQMNEVVMFHRASATLIVCDLIFNIHEVKGLVTKVMLCCAGAHKRTAQSRVWRMLTKNRKAAGRSVASLLDLPFDRVVPSHGLLVETEARQTLAQACHWMLKAT
ncbi:DUF4336 domain-containing protein [Sulfidibacter corallicola]|uniref:DUF4336 domain-containing protein n=1 Tax=Sulfidibacter corallicola TaxID=2818388 RepID=A0A8A4TMQ0_SULCO|nr:DUF4336 domain-containing protein [Sulfidibacter corallicola]QTD50161.1 DUF4336 domain-containing protein [Sulfidibacter corallicola]